MICVGVLSPQLVLPIGVADKASAISDAVVPLLLALPPPYQFDPTRNATELASTTLVLPSTAL